MAFPTTSPLVLVLVPVPQSARIIKQVKRAEVKVVVDEHYLLCHIVFSIFEWIGWWVNDVCEINEGRFMDRQQQERQQEEQDRHKDREGSLVPEGIGVGGGGGIWVVLMENEVWSYIILIWMTVDIEDIRVDGVRKSRKMYLTGRPGVQQGTSGGKPIPIDGSKPSEVLLLQRILGPEGFFPFFLTVYIQINRFLPIIVQGEE
ncbi:hypothetical protein K435DRAFT_800020 [Dendrothele bispora CBS 962.96]|uniref:Uncharacterized protein n=1 Tax=Dendrothele bispora (strain CBS 962.96) TaxID=1314807 RepID=A0A4S8LV99_DENBC|nr:hypothetical protein K435DRAFT_800020 [Dendrothele bispora CBS 962.96]